MTQFNLLRVPHIAVLLMALFLVDACSINAQNSYSCDIRANDQLSTESSRRVPNQAISVTRGGYNPWTGLQNAELEDSRHISVTIDPHRSSEVLRLNNFNFDLPNNVNITGIQVRMSGGADTDLSPWEQIIRLTDASGNMVGDNRANHEIEGDAWNIDTTSTLGYWTYGSSADLWDSNWTPSTINSSNFGIAIQTKSRNDIPSTFSLDQVTIIVYYDSPIQICEGHACIPVTVPFDEDVVSYNWSVQGGIRWEPSGNDPNIINVIADGASFGDYTVCLDRTYTDGRNETCCRGISYGSCATGSIGDFLWQDTNGNGFQDAGEPGLSNCRVYLFTESLQFVESVLTENGFYLFENLDPDNYIIQVDVKDLCSTISDSSNPTLNSDFYQAYLPNATDIIPLGANEHIRNIDFGLIQKGTITGLTWVDKDGNGLYEENIDCTIGDIKVSVVNAVGDTILCVFSEPDGTYIVDGVPQGDYILKFGFPSEYLPTSQGADSDTSVDHCSDTVTVREGVNTVVNAGAFRPSTLGNYVWIDSNENGIQDPDEQGIEGAIVTLLSCNDVLIGEYRTDANGQYQIPGIAPGNYKLCVDSGRSDLVATQSNVGDDNLDSDLESDGCTACITVLENTNDQSIDFGYFSGLAQIDVYTFLDNNNDGINDNNDTPLEGVGVEVYTCSGDLVFSTTTNNFGAAWEDFAQGDYYIRIVPPAGFQIRQGGIITNGNGAGTTDCLNTLPIGFSIEVPLITDEPNITVLIYNDINGDGINDPSDPAISGITVDIFSCNGTLITTTTTDALGMVLRAIPEGDVYFRIVPPSGFVFAFGSIVDGSNGEGTTPCLTVGPDGLDIEIGLVESNAQIDVYVYNDLNNDGINDPTDTPVEGVTVEIYDCTTGLLVSLVTNNFGAVWQYNIVNSEYYIRVVPPAGFQIRPGGIITNANGPGTTDCLGSAPIGFTIEVGLIPDNGSNNGVITGTIWQDDNGTSTNDNEPPAAGVNVSLYTCNGILVASTQTDANGTYTFTNIPSGSYYIQVEGQPGSSLSIGGQSGISDANGAGTSDCVTIDDDSSVTIDVGLTPLSVIGDYVWLDANVNGIQDAGESPIADVDLHLIDANGTEVAATVTDANGAYSFAAVRPGDYTIELRDDREFGVTLQNFGDPSTDSNLRLDSGRFVSTTITVAGGEDNLDIDLGLTIEQAIVGGLVFLDENLDGTLSNADDRIEGVSVELYASNGTLAQSLVTDASGVYVFFNVIPGDYYIQFNITDDFMYTIPNVGNDELFDSDVTDSTSGQTEVFTADGGDVIQGINAGLAITSACISGVFWDDLNRDGILDNADASLAGNTASNLRVSEERRIDNATVNLFRQDGTFVMTDITDFDGQYSFCDIDAGSYYVEFVLPENYVFTLPNLGNDDELDSDVTDLINGTTDIISVTNGTIISNVSAGAYEQNTVVSGRIWFDENEDGILDPLEGGLSGVTINMIDANNVTALTTMSNLDGDFLFTNPIAGTYTFELVLQDTLQLTESMVGGDPSVYSHFNPSDARTATVLIEDGNLYPNINAGLIDRNDYVTQARVGGRIWLDENENGLLEVVERGLDEMTINLLRDDNTVMASIQTDNNGNYEFTDIPEGNYRLEVENEDEYDLTLPFVGSDPATQSHFYPLDRRSDMLSLSQGDIVNNMQAGLVTKQSSISGTVWNDENGNGLFNSVETGVQGITINLIDNSGVTVQAVFSDANGDYVFNNIEAGDYVIEVIAGDDYDYTLAYMGGNADIYSHVFRVNGRTPIISLGQGENLANINAGLIEVINTQIAGRVWNDENEDGILDSTESGFESITVELYQTNGTLIASTLTSVTGGYSFDNLIADSYYVKFGLIDDYEFTIPRVGGSTPNNSDVTDLVEGTTNSFQINTGQQFVNIHAGLIRSEVIVTDETGDITGFVWEDMNGDGTRELNEPGENGVRVTLLDASGASVAEDFTTNDPDLGAPGYYHFEDIAVGSYTLSFDLDNDALITSQGADSKLVSAFVTETVSVTPQSNVRIDAGYFFTGSIGDFVWNDTNSNGVQDADELGAQNFFVQLFDTNNQQVGFVFSGTDGSYSFDNLIPGEYFVKVDFQLGISFSPSGSGDAETDTNINNDNGLGTSSNITVQSGTINNTIDIGLIIAPATVGDFVFSDSNANGVQDPGEVGINGIDVMLYDSNDNLIETTTTANDGSTDGKYLFEEIPLGNYYLVFDVPADMDITAKDQGGDDSKDSDVDNSQTYGSTSIFELSAGETDLDIDAGVIVTLSIGERVWFDRDGNGLYDNGESGIDDVVVTLYDGDGQYMDNVSTNFQGLYKFSNVTPGDYYVHFLLPDNFVATAKGDGSEDNESKLNEDGTTDLFTVSSGIGRSDINAGAVRPHNELSGLVWWDENEDGLYDLEEDLMEGMTVWLLNTNLQLLDEAVTGPTGRYAFSDLPNGPYILQFVQASSMLFTDRNVGLDDEVDSDVDDFGYTSAINLSGQTIERFVFAGLIDNSRPSISEIYPNPVPNGQLTLNVRARTDAETPQFSLYNLNGQLLESWSADAPQAAGWHSYSIKLNTIDDGQYILKVKTNRSEEIHKVVLVRE
jgi:protocatechuate 3,4-dioxygenase beta subunit